MIHRLEDDFYNGNNVKQKLEILLVYLAHCLIVLLLLMLISTYINQSYL